MGCTDKHAVTNCDMVERRQALFERLGGLPETTIHNTEWLYMLQEDTRQSLAIEGYFASEDDLDRVLHGGKTDLEIVNYFRMAQTAYDQALQYYRDRIPAPLDLPTVRHMHSELFRNIDSQRGSFRKGAIQIHGAKILPPEHDVDAYVRAALRITSDLVREMPVLSALARAHTLFESIHPFPDGNGRVGRILLNYLAISNGYPPIVIKGVEKSERQTYYTALEAADRGFQRGFPPPTYRALRAELETGEFNPLIEILCEGVFFRLERMTVVALEQQDPLLELPDVAALLGVSEVALRQRIHRGTMIAVKRGKKLYTHPRLVVERTSGTD